MLLCFLIEHHDLLLIWHFCDVDYVRQPPSPSGWNSHQS